MPGEPSGQQSEPSISRGRQRSDPQTAPMDVKRRLWPRTTGAGPNHDGEPANQRPLRRGERCETGIRRICSGQIGEPWGNRSVVHGRGFHADLTDQSRRAKTSFGIPPLLRRATLLILPSSHRTSIVLIECRERSRPTRKIC